MSQRQKYYQDFIAHPEAVDYKTWCQTVWFYPTGEQLRLNSLGVELFSQKFTPYTVLVPADRRKAKHYLFLNRYCKKPYFIEAGKVIFFDEHEAMVFKLCDGDFDNVDELIKGDKDGN